MKNLWWASGPVAFAAAVFASCGTSTSGSLSLSGPSCQNGMISIPGAVATTPTCQMCTQSACVGQTGCFTSDCATYFNCLCACAPNDSTCFSMCSLPSACQGCLANFETCSANAANGGGACAAQCAVIDAGSLTGG
jgi:hypothetical protein